MSPSVSEFLASFDRLTARESQEATAEILRRAVDADLPTLSDKDLVDLASLTFAELDEREAADARP